MKSFPFFQETKNSTQIEKKKDKPDKKSAPKNVDKKAVGKHAKTAVENPSKEPVKTKAVETKTVKTKVVEKTAVSPTSGKEGMKGGEKKSKKQVQPLIYEVIGNQKQVKSNKRSKSEKEER